MTMKKLTWSSPVIFTLFILPVFANNNITIHVTTNEKTNAALGYTVVGKKSGGLGSSYVGHGPSDQLYFFFGYRKTVFGENVSCGNLRLRQNSRVLLVIKNNVCRSIVQCQ